MELCLLLLSVVELAPRSLLVNCVTRAQRGPRVQRPRGPGVLRDLVGALSQQPRVRATCTSRRAYHLLRLRSSQQSCVAACFPLLRLSVVARAGALLARSTPRV